MYMILKVMVNKKHKASFGQKLVAAIKSGFGLDVHNLTIHYDSKKDRLKTSSSWWGTTYPETEKLGRILLHGMEGNFTCHISYKPKSSLKVNIKDGHAGFEIDFSADLAQKTVTHGITRFKNKNFQAHDLGKKLMANRWALYNTLGIKTVKSLFTWVGSYAFARYGFIPTREDWNKYVKPEIRKRLKNIMQEYNISKETLAKISRALRSANPVRLWDIVDLRDKAGDKRLSFRLMEENSWDGTFKMDNPEQITRIRKYIGQDVLTEAFNYARAVSRETAVNAPLKPKQPLFTA